MSKIKKLIKEKCPNGVEYKTIKETFNLFSGMTGVTNKWADDGNCQFIDYMNAYKNNKIDVKKLPYATVKNLKQNELLKGDLLLTNASEVPDECAISSVIENDIRSGIFMDDHLFGLRLKEEYINKINTTFINYYLNSKPFRDNLFKAVRGVTRFYISNDNYVKLSIPIPPIEIQEEIVKILDKFGELEAKLEEELEARRSQYEFWRGRLFYEGDYKKLSELAEIGTGSSNTNQALPKGKYYFYTRSQEIYYMNEYEYDDESIITAGDGAGVGKSIHYVNGKYALHQRAYRICPNSNILLPKYLYFYMKYSFYDYILGAAVSSSVTSIRRKMLDDYPIPVPPIGVQKHIVNILDKFDKLINDISEGIPAEIELRRKQYEYYRNKLLSFKELSSDE